MITIPTISLRGGACALALRAAADISDKRRSDSPVGLARDFGPAAGFPQVHVADLDAHRTARARTRPVIDRIVRDGAIGIQGSRQAPRRPTRSIRLFGAGAARVVLDVVTPSKSRAWLATMAEACPGSVVSRQRERPRNDAS